jgi:hypothetical protein
MILRITLLFLTIIAFSQLMAQDYLNACFYCHMDIIAEVKTKATLHWESGVSCTACHGKSEEHVDVEDNSIKPNQVWSDSSVHMLCKDCHDNQFQEFKESEHAGWYYSDEKTDTSNIISCVTCHGAHGFKSFREIEISCRECHISLPSFCSQDQELPKTQDEAFSCNNCHNIHSLARKEKE